MSKNAKKVFIIALLLFSLIQFSYADSFTVNVPNSQGGYTAVVIQSSGTGYVGPRGEYYQNFPSVNQLQAMYGPTAAPGPSDAVQRENMLRQQLQQGADETAANQKRMEQQSQQILLQEQQKAQFQAAHPFGIPTPAEAKKNAMDWLIANSFTWLLLLTSIGFLVFILLLHLPNRLIGPDHPVQELPLAIAVRRGMTKARFNTSVSPLIFWEMFFITILVGIGFKSFLAFFIAVLIGIVLMSIRTSAFILIYLFSTFWMLVAAQCGYLLCGGQFASIGSYVSAWIGGLIAAALGFMIAFGIHTAGLQYYEDISS